jgi:myo-inositol-1(or 4)-monophosphatase
MEKYLEACIKSATAGGKAILDYTPEGVKTKNDKYVSDHHSVSTPADYKSQKAILLELKKYDPEALLITEEHVKEDAFIKRLITRGALQRIGSSRVYIIDELDGTSSYAAGHYEWSVSVGCVDRLNHTAGAVFAPKIDGGTLFYASKGNGSFIKDKKGKRQIQVADRELKDAYIVSGVDCFLPEYPIHNKLLTLLGNKVRTTNSNGSCALGLGLVASGKADALIQPLQSPWDWAGGKPIVEEADGNFIFYEMKKGRVYPIDKPELKHYNPDEKTLGFIAGNEKMNNIIMELLLGIKL